MFCCRYVTAERYSEALDILHSGACLQLAHGQVVLGFLFSCLSRLFRSFFIISRVGETTRFSLLAL